MNNTILIVDDIDQNLAVLEKILRKNGFSVVSANNGKNALEKLENERIDLIISDLLMPVMDGYTFCMHVRKDDRFQNIPIIFCTGTYIDEQDESLAYKIGADRFIRKPYSMDVLIDNVQELFNESDRKRIEPDKDSDDYKESLSEYNRTLVRKLEKKMIEYRDEVEKRQGSEEKQKTLLKKQELLNSVHDSIWMMKTPGDISIVLHTIRNSLSAYGVRFDNLGVNVIDFNDCHLKVNEYVTDINGKTVIHDDTPGKDIIYSIWKEAKTLVRNNIHIKDSLKESDTINEMYKSVIKSVLDVPFSHGTIAINSRDEDAFSSHDMIFLEEIALILSKGFYRMKDLEKLAVSEMQMHELIDNMRSGLILLKKNVDTGAFIVQRINAAGAVIDSIDEKAIIGKSFTEAYPGILAIGLDKLIDRVWKTEIAEQHPARFYKDEIRSGWREFYVYKLSTGEIAVIYDDVSEQKQGEEALMRWAQIFEIAEWGVVVSLPDRTGFEMMNSAFAKQHGYSTDELMEYPLEAIIEESERVIFQEKMSLADKTGHLTFECLHKRKDGSVFPALNDVTVVKELDGSIQHCIINIQDISHRIEAEKAVKESETRYRVLFDTAAEGILITDCGNRKIHYANKAISKLFQYNQSELLSMSLSDFQPNDSTRQLFLRLKEESVDNKVHLTNIPCMRKDGTILYTDISSAIATINGEESCISFFTDVTKRKQAEEEIKRAYQLQTVINSIMRLSLNKLPLDEILSRSLNLILSIEELSIEAKGAILLTDDSGKTLDMKVQHGLSEKIQILCEHVPFGTCICGKAAVSRKIEFVDTVDDDHSIQYNGMSSHGHYCVPFLSQEKKTLGVLNIYVKDGHVRGQNEIEYLEAIANVLAGIVQRIKDEEERARLTTAIEQAAESVIITNKEGIIQYVNPAFTEMSGYSRENSIGKKPSLLKSGKQPPEYYKDLWKSISSGSVWIGRFHNKKKDGSLFEMESTITPIRNNNNIITNYVAVGRDVTYQHSIEKRLRETQKMEAVGTLAGGIAHDFNNILASIIGFSELGLSEAEENSQLYSDLERILMAGQRATSLISQILAFSRHQEEEYHSLSLLPILKEAIKFLRATLPTTVEIREKINPEIKSILGDPTQVHQIIMNLSTNAGHAMKESGGILSFQLDMVELDEEFVSLHPEVNPGEYVVLTVSDTGHGIDKAIVDRIFEPYYTTKRKGEGTGLGLAVVHGIVASYHGTITVYSEIDKGTVFKIFLPVNESQEVKKIVEKEEILTGNERILFVDDEKDIVDMGERLLSSLGYEADVFTDPSQALEYFSEMPELYDLVISDMTMPQIPGDILAQEILKIRPDIPIIICTGFSDRINEEKAYEIGIRSYLKKPLLKKQLAEAIRKVL